MPSDAAQEPDAGSAAPDMAKLKWQCRRGMLELDYLLEEFLERHYLALPAQQRDDFVKLLDYPDQILQDWFMGRSVPREAPMQRLVERILAKD